MEPRPELASSRSRGPQSVTRGSQRHISSPEHPIRNGPHDHPECPKIAAGRQSGPGKGDKHGEVPVPGELIVAREDEAIEEHEAVSFTFLDRRIYAQSPSADASAARHSTYRSCAPRLQVGQVGDVLNAVHFCGSSGV